MRPAFPLIAKITGAAFLVALLVLLFVGHAQYQEDRRQLVEKFGMTLQHIAQTTALFLDGDEHERIRSSGDRDSPAFLRQRALLQRVRAANHLRQEQIYTLRPLRPGQLEFVVMLQERTFIGDRYAPPPATSAIVQQVLSDGQPRYTPLYRDENGTYVSGYAPIRDSAGRVVALLEVDYALDAVMTELQAQLSRKLWMPPVALLLALLLSSLIARSITGAVKELVRATVAVQRGDYDHHVAVHTRDELRALGEAFNAMLPILRERFAMLRFLPRHTRAVIAAAAKERTASQGGAVAQRRQVALLFSDIRGFTALSESLPPERVVEMLNIFLRHEAQIIEEEDGSVDKFIGDAVMALFEGADRCERAVRAASRIQRKIRDLNLESAFERQITVGIGIAAGEVVMGNIGYEGRQEFAVIGRYVNLAARLTSIASGGEVVVTAAVYQALGQALQQAPGQERAAGEQLPPQHLKGFAEPVDCYRLSI